MDENLKNFFIKLCEQVYTFDGEFHFPFGKIQLNDEYEGGELQIKDKDNNEITLDKGLGNLFLFYSHIEHRVMPILDGTRYSLVNWFKLAPIENFKKTLI